MKPVVGQNLATCLGAVRGISIAALIGAFLLVPAHLLNPAISWYYPGVTLGVAVAAHLLYSAYLSQILKK